MEKWKDAIDQAVRQRISHEREAHRLGQEELREETVKQAAEKFRLQTEELEKRRKISEAMQSLEIKELIEKTKREIWSNHGKIINTSKNPGFRLALEYDRSFTYTIGVGGGYDGPSGYETVTKRGKGYTFTEVSISDYYEDLITFRDGEYEGIPDTNRSHWKNFLNKGDEIYSYEVSHFTQSIDFKTLPLNGATRSNISEILFEYGINRAKTGRLPENF